MLVIISKRRRGRVTRSITRFQVWDNIKSKLRTGSEKEFSRARGGGGGDDRDLVGLID